VVSDDVRAVTDEEVARFRDHGWVKLDQLISPAMVENLLEGAREYIGPNGDAHEVREGIDAPNLHWVDRHNLVREDERFGAVGLSPRMGSNVARLLRRDVGALLAADMVAVKIGKHQDSPSMRRLATPWHQDAPDHPIDRNGYVSFWIALDHITPDMGGLRFVDRSNHLGLLGRTHTDLFALYPELSDMPLSESFHFRPGDATAHSTYTVHGTADNETGRPRWALIIAYLPEDAVFTGGLPWSLSTYARRAAALLKPGERFTDRVCVKVPG
jgi:ectoine hydroxylase-related dioxygenase (phytanoyl-CoA dioxygenase family)